MNFTVGKLYEINISSSNHPEWLIGRYTHPADIVRFHVFDIGLGRAIVHDSCIRDYQEPREYEHHQNHHRQTLQPRFV